MSTGRPGAPIGSAFAAFDDEARRPLGALEPVVGCAEDTGYRAVEDIMLSGDRRAGCEVCDCW